MTCSVPGAEQVLGITYWLNRLPGTTDCTEEETDTQGVEVCGESRAERGRQGIRPSGLTPSLEPRIFSRPVGCNVPKQTKNWRAHTHGLVFRSRGLAEMRDPEAEKQLVQETPPNSFAPVPPETGTTFPRRPCGTHVSATRLASPLTARWGRCGDPSVAP